MGRVIKKYTEFISEEANNPKPSTTPSPTIAPPKTKPNTPAKPHDPIRRERPSVDPRPKAKNKYKKATSENAADRFISELKNMGKEPINGLDYESLKKRWENK